MFGVGLPELIVILIIALLVVDPERLPDLVRMLGRSVGELRRAANELRTSFDEEGQRLAEEMHKNPAASVKTEMKPDTQPEVHPKISPDRNPPSLTKDDS